jgi:phage I-like protein
MQIVHLHNILPETGGAPEWVHLLPAGTFRGADGRGPYSVRNPDAIVAAQAARGKLVLDENHSTDHAMTHGGEAPARGWIVELQNRQDGVWGRVDWTPSGKKLMADRAYRGISPAIAVRETSGEVSEIVRASLTNAPNLPLQHLHSQEPQMNLTALREALGLPADADEAAILAAARNTRATVQTHSTQISRIAVAAGLAADAVPDAIVTGLQTRGTTDAQVVVLQSQVSELKTQLARGAAEKAIDAALAAGKAIPQQKRDEWIDRYVKDPVFVQGVMDGMPSLHSGGLPAQRQVGRANPQDDADTLAARSLGITKEQLVAHRATTGAH